MFYKYILDINYDNLGMQGGEWIFWTK